MLKDLLKDLNEAQKEAVINFEGPALVIAGAGSGKTRVLTYRIAYMLSREVHPAQILALTFTNKAAAEMKGRIAELVGEPLARKLWMGTFHSIFARILRIEHEAISFPRDYTIYDTADSKNLVKTIIKEMNLSDDIYKPAEVLGRISYSKNNLITPESYFASADLMTRDKATRRPEIAEIYSRYWIRCRKSGVMDFDDLLLNTNILFRDHPEILQKYQHAFRFILVDEYQDTNYSQFIIIRKLAQTHSNICVVGDDAQSIYSFRGARIENILNFKRDYPDISMYKLERNYRSTRKIVNAANSIIARNKGQIEKSVYSMKEEGDKIRLIEAKNDNEEGFLIANLIRDISLSRQFHYSDIAILYRTNAQSRIFEESLRKVNIPYKIYGGVSFFQRKEIKDILAWFRLVINPTDDESFKRAISFPSRGIGKTTLLKIEELSVLSGKSMWETTADLLILQKNFNSGINRKIVDFINLVKEFREKIPEMEAFDLAYSVLTKANIMGELRKDETPEGISRIDNTEALLNGIREFTEAEGDGFNRGLPDYLQTVTLLTDADTEKPEDHNKVTLMTIHAAKGLEFKHVSIVGMEENLFPSGLSLDDPRELEEERRLFYVALTRAEESVSLSYANSRYKWGILNMSRPSRFISEIDEEFLELPYTYISIPSKGFDDLFEAGNKRYTRETEFPGKTKYIPSRNLSSPGNSPSIPPEPPSDLSEITVGTLVEHSRFGTGTVVERERDKATVDFKGHGRKQLLLRFAKLRIIR